MCHNCLSVRMWMKVHIFFKSYVLLGTISPIFAHKCVLKCHFQQLNLLPSKNSTWFVLSIPKVGTYNATVILASVFVLHHATLRSNFEFFFSTVTRLKFQSRTVIDQSVSSHQWFKIFISSGDWGVQVLNSSFEICMDSWIFRSKRSKDFICWRTL